MKLVREVRFGVGGVDSRPAGAHASRAEPVGNSWAGWPAAVGIQPFLVMRLGLEGEPDPLTGYICNITVLDRLVRELTIPQIDGLLSTGSAGPQLISPAPGDGGHVPLRETPTAERVLGAIVPELQTRAPVGTRLAFIQLQLTPFLQYELRLGEPDMIYLSETFEFSAAHRLHCPSLTDRQNRDIFGKCNNPSGHGHNYLLEVTVGSEPDATTGLLLPIERLERTVKERVIDRFDHKHLNVDCPEFAALNPSVEHITRVIWSLLAGRFAPARLARVRVWETGKTCAEYEGE
jgi:6-pyruvoyltetrahydropterin/6-carboxytetrahydropterin synthase